jgi:hypothetical protein
MARRKKPLLVAERTERFTKARNLFAKVVTNRAAGLVLPVVTEKISIQVQEGKHCGLKFYKERGYYVSEIVDPSIKADVDELLSSMLLNKIGSRRESTVIFNTMSTGQSTLLNDHRKSLNIGMDVRIDQGRNQLKKTHLSDSSADDRRLKILIEKIENHLQKKILSELNVGVPDDKRIMTVSLLETQPPVQYSELVDGNVISQVDSVSMLILNLCFSSVLLAKPFVGTRPASPS